MSRRNSILVGKTIYQISVITLVAAIVWVGTGVYMAITKAPSINIEKELLEPITTNINQDIVTVLSNRLKVESTFTPDRESSENANIAEDAIIIDEGQTP